MNREDMEFISGTETCRSLSNFCIYGALVFLVAYEFKITGSFLDWVPSGTVSIVLAILAVAWRVIAIDRFLRMSRQQDYEERHPNID